MTTRRLALFAALFLSALPVQAKLAPERWARLTEEERHHLTIAERYVDQNAIKGALAEYELFLQLFPKSEVASYAQFMFAECTRRTGQVNTAIEEFRNVIDYFPDSTDAASAQYSIGLCETQAGDSEKAVAAFEKVIEKWPKTDFGAQARNDVCAIYFRLGQIEKWLPHITFLATDEYADSQNIRSNAQEALMTYLLVQKKTANAFALIDQTHKKDALLVFAEWTAGALPRSIPTLYGEKGVKARPEIAAETVALVEKQSATITDPVQKNALEHWCARIFANAGVIEEAGKRFAALTKKNPADDTLRMEYAGYLRASGKRGEARLVYHELKDPFNGDREIAETYGEEGNWDGCIEAYKSMLAKYPQQVAQIQGRLGTLYQRIGKPQEAIACYQQSQGEPQSLFRVAECQAALKQYDAAIQTLVGVLNFFKADAPEAQYRIAGVQAAKGNKDAAIKTLKTLCRVYLNTPWAGRAHQDLSLTYGVDVTLGGSSKKDDR